MLLSLLWIVLAPAYAHLLAAMARPLIPSIESTRGTRYLVEGTKIIADRPIVHRTPQQVTAIRQPIRDTSGDYDLALLAALLLATPAWSCRRRSRALAWSLGLLILSQFVSLLVAAEYTKLWPTRTEVGTAVSIDYSRAKLIFFDWLYAFFEFMRHGFFALLLYLGAIALTWGRSDRAGAAAVGRNDPCPCGSGLKAKRCCAA